MAFNAWCEAVDFKVLKFQNVNVRESGKVAQVTAAECMRHEPRICATPSLHPLLYSDLFYVKHQA